MQFTWCKADSPGRATVAHISPRFRQAGHFGEARLEGKLPLQAIQLTTSFQRRQYAMTLRSHLMCISAFQFWQIPRIRIYEGFFAGFLPGGPGSDGAALFRSVTSGFPAENLVCDISHIRRKSTLTLSGEICKSGCRSPAVLVRNLAQKCPSFGARHRLRRPSQEVAFSLVPARPYPGRKPCIRFPVRSRSICGGHPAPPRVHLETKIVDIDIHDVGARLPPPSASFLRQRAARHARRDAGATTPAGQTPSPSGQSSSLRASPCAPRGAAWSSQRSTRNGKLLAAQQRPTARGQVDKVEWFQQAVVRPKIQALHPCLQAAAPGQYQHSGIVMPRPQLRQHLHAVQLRQSQVQHDQVEPVVRGMSQGRLPVLHPIHTVAFPPPALSSQTRPESDRLHNQHTHESPRNRICNPDFSSNRSAARHSHETLVLLIDED